MWIRIPKGIGSLSWQSTTRRQNSSRFLPSLRNASSSPFRSSSGLSKTDGAAPPVRRFGSVRWLFNILYSRFITHKFSTDPNSIYSVNPSGDASNETLATQSLILIDWWALNCDENWGGASVGATYAHFYSHRVGQRSCSEVAWDSRHRRKPPSFKGGPEWSFLLGWICHLVNSTKHSKKGIHFY